VEGVEHTAQEKIEMAAKAKIINRSGTRFSSDPFKQPLPVTSRASTLGVPGMCTLSGNQRSRD